MSTAHVIGFDGTPLEGGPEARTAILRVDGGEQLHVTDGRHLSRSRFEELVTRGYVTRLDPMIAAERTDGVIVYRTIEPTRGSVEVQITDVRWNQQGGIEVAYLSHEQARQVLESHARIQLLRAIAAVRERHWQTASQLARRGLAAVPEARISTLASDLYAVLVAANFMDGDRLARIQREIDLLLGRDLQERAMKDGLWLVATGTRSASAADHEVTVSVGAMTPPRQRAG